jgi:hypothetical protein
MVDIDDFMRAVEAAWQKAYPGREATTRNDALRELRRLLDARERAPQNKCARRGAFIRLRLIGRD